MKLSDKQKKKIMNSVTVGVAGASLIAASTLKPSDAIATEEINDKNRIVINYDNKEVKKETITDKIPLAIKAIICIPLWAIGTLLLKLFNKLFNVVISPILLFLLNSLLLFLLLLAIIVVCIKILFPDKSIKEILNKKLVLTVAAASIIIQLLDLLLPKLISNYKQFKYTCIFAFGLLFICILLIPLIRKKVNEPKIIYDESLLND